MLRVSRPTSVPEFLLSPRVQEEQKNLFAYLRRDADERKSRRDNLNEDIFFSSDLLSILSETFKQKCAFCETVIGFHGNTLHFRPLRFAETGKTHNNEYYLWLAFEWRNLFYACDYCVRSKGNKFPIKSTPANYLSTYESIIRNEKPLLVDPTSEDPGRHLYFSISGDAFGLTEKGRHSIETFNLNRDELKSERKILINQLLETLGQTPNYNVEKLLDSSAPQAGVLRSVLKRLVETWKSYPVSPSGGGNAFIQRFFESWFKATEAQLTSLRESISHIRNNQSIPDLHIPTIYSFIEELPASIFEEIRGEISNIQITNFRAIKDLEIRIPSKRTMRAGAPSLVILGENSTGKSSILAAIALALIGSREARKFKKHFPSLVHSSSQIRFDQLDQPDIKVDIGFHALSYQSSFQYDPMLSKLEGPPNPTLIVLGYGPRRFFDPKRQEYKYGEAERVKTLFDPLATIPYPGDWLRAQTGSRFDTIAAALRIVLAMDDADELLIESDYLAVRANGRITPIDSLSEGYKSVFVMTIDIIRELLQHWDNLEQAQAVVLIDELETHLHPRWKMQVMTSLRRVFPRVQFIVTTHDPLCLRGMDDNEVIVLQRDETGHISPLEGLPSVKGMTAEQLLTSDYFGLASTTDPSTEIELARLAGDVIRSQNNQHKTLPAASTMALISHLSLGDSPTEQIIQDALVKYLEGREVQRGRLQPALREQAVNAVLKALTDSEN